MTARVEIRSVHEESRGRVVAVLACGHGRSGRASALKAGGRTKCKLCNGARPGGAEELVALAQRLLAAAGVQQPTPKPDPTEVRRCPKCGVEGFVDEAFGRRGTGLPQSWCKECRNRRPTEHIAATGETS